MKSSTFISTANCSFAIKTTSNKDKSDTVKFRYKDHQLD